VDAHAIQLAELKRKRKFPAAVFLSATTTLKQLKQFLILLLLLWTAESPAMMQVPQ
jgi:hypothetical protein